MAKYSAALTATQAGLVVKSLLMLGVQKVTVEEKEKGRFVIVTYEAAK